MESSSQSISQRFDAISNELRLILVGTTAVTLYYLIPAVGRAAESAVADLIHPFLLVEYSTALQALNSGIVIALALLASLFMPGRLTGYVWEGRRSIVEIVIGLVIGMAGFVLPLLPFLISYTSPLWGFELASVVEAVGLSVVLSAISGAILSQLVFRSWLYTLVDKAYGPTWAVILTTVIYLALNVGSGAINGMLPLALLYAGCRKNTQRLWLSTALDFGISFVTVGLFLVIPLDYDPRLLSGVEISWLTINIFSIMLITGLVAAYFLFADPTRIVLASKSRLDNTATLSPKNINEE